MIVYLLDFELCEEEVNVFGDVELVLPGVAHQVGVEHIVRLAEYPRDVAETQSNHGWQALQKWGFWGKKSHFQILTYLCRT